MPSPDVTQYIDLRLFDKDPQDVFEAALLDLKTKLPTWVPREGNIEVLLLEALALEVSESLFAINRLPSAIVEVLLRLYGINRDSGAAPVVSLRFDMVDNAGYTIPAGVQARLNLPGGFTPVFFTTSVALTIPFGSTYGVVDAVGDRFTDEANGTTAGTTLDLMDSIIAVDTVKLESFVTLGRNPEQQQEYFSRALTRFSRLSDTLLMPSDFANYALEQPIVERAKAFDNWNGTAGVPGDHPGHITVAVYGNGTTLSTPAKSALETEMSNLAMASLSIHVIDPTIIPQDVTASVKALPGYDTDEVQAACEAALIEYLNPMTWEWSPTIRVYELVSLLDRVPGVDYVDTITTPSSDVTLSGVAVLATVGDLNITVS